MAGSTSRFVVERPAARRLLAVLAVGLLPWTVLQWDGGFGFVFVFGLVNPDAPHLVLLPDYLFRLTGGPASLPRRLLAWPVGGLLWSLAAASAAGGVAVDREDSRVTGWLLVLAGGSLLWFSTGLGRPDLLALPVGTAVLWAVAWVWYGSSLLRVVGR